MMTKINETTTKGKVLVVDDEAIVRDSIGEWLRDAGYDVIQAEDGYKALEIVGLKKVDAVVVDLKMPGIDGLEVLKEIKRKTPETNVIIITAYGTVESAVDAMRIGASDYFLKPFEPENLEQAIENVIKEAKKGYKEYTEKKEEIEKKIEIDREALEGCMKEAEEHYKNKDYNLAVEKFKEALQIDPSNIIAKQGAVKSERQKIFFEITKKTAKTKAKDKKETKVSEKQCVWAKLGVVSYRVCTLNFKCEACEFAQSMMDKEEGYEESGFSEIRKKLLALPATSRKCRYMLSQEVAYKLCPNLYRCGTCGYDQMVQDMKEQKAETLTSKLKKRVEKVTALV